jgi:hypothetical protein
MRTDDEHGGWQAPGCQAGTSPAVTAALAALDDALGSLAALPLSTLPDGDVVRLLDGLTAAPARMTSTLGDVAVEADRRRLGDPAGARNTVTWWAARSRLTRGEAGRVLALAHELEDDLHQPVADALRDGRMLADQAGVIVYAVEQLPADLGHDVRVRARDHLLEAADHHDARRLRVLGRRILEVVAPAVAESHEQRLLEAEERRAAARARFTMVDDGHGQCHGRFTLPSLQGHLLREHLHALASPSRRPTEDLPPPGRPVITPQRLGEALMDYVERYPTDRLPRHGGNATTLTVTLDLDALVSGAGAATLTTGHRISAGERDVWPAGQVCCPRCSAAAPRCSTSDAPAGSSPRPNDAPWRCATVAAPPRGVGSRPASATPTTTTRGPRAAPPTSHSAGCSAHATTGWPTTATTRCAGSTAAASPSTGGRESPG